MKRCILIQFMDAMTIVLTTAVGAAWAAETPAAPAATPAVQWNHQGFCEVVHPMKHDLKGRLPLLAWSLPRPDDQGDNLVRLHKSGELKKMALDVWQRGIAWEIMFDWRWTMDGAMATGQALHEARIPVFVRIGDRERSKPNHPYFNSPKAKGKVVVSGTFDSDDAKFAEVEMPSLPKYDPQPLAEMHRGYMQKLKQAGVTVNGFFSDQESHPHPFNYIYQHQKQNFAADYPPGTFDSEQAFFNYVLGVLRPKYFADCYAEPVLSVFPHALVGNYDDTVATPARPFIETNGFPNYVRNIGRLNTLMPSVYANTTHLPRYYNADWPVNQENVDEVFFHFMLMAMSTALANKQPGQKAVPYVSDNCPDLNLRGSRFFSYRMSEGVYKEFLRHSLLRGADTFFYYSCGPTPGVPNSAAGDILQSVEYTRAVYDQMLEYRQFLDEGVPMNFEVPVVRSRGVVWSGRRWKDQALVRAFTLSPSAKRFGVVAFPGVAVELDATLKGTTYLIARDGSVRTLPEQE
jgi:hypothetical protein